MQTQSLCSGYKPKNRGSLQRIWSACNGKGQQDGKRVSAQQHSSALPARGVSCIRAGIIEFSEICWCWAPNEVPHEDLLLGDLLYVYSVSWKIGFVSHMILSVKIHLWNQQIDYYLASKIQQFKRWFFFPQFLKLLIHFHLLPFIILKLKWLCFEQAFTSA